MDSVAIVGAGAFGACLAWRLAQAGVAVTLVDQFEPGDGRATSGGETRLLRCAHGADAWYARSARRAREGWRELEAETGESLYLETGVVWFARRADGWEAASERVLAALAIPCERVDPGAHFPAVGTDDLAFALLEPEAGAVRAQRAVRAAVQAAVARGAQVLRGRARPEGGAIRCADGTRLQADRVVWACGGWLGELFGALAPIRGTRQDLLFFDGGPRWRDAPAWVDYDGAIYGTGDLDGLGVKVAPDTEGPALGFDAPLPEGPRDAEPAARAYLARRFPSLAAAPLKLARACRYELTADSHFIAAPHPEHPHVWLLGGGSGHGFKHAPALAEQMIQWLSGKALPPATLGLGERAPGRSLRTAGSSPASRAGLVAGGNVRCG